MNHYPKMLYLGGVVRDEQGRPVRHDNTRLVHDGDQEAAAREEGFTDALEPDPAGLSEDQLAVLAGAEGDGAPDADGDGHDDTDGTFVSPNPGRRGKK